MVAWPHCVDRLLELTYRAEQLHFWFRGFRQYMAPALARATAGVSRARILDCGCGTGANLEMLRPYGSAVGFDLTAIGAQFARAHGHRVAQASIGQIPFRSGTFDLATSFDVFQVLPDSVERDAIREMAPRSRSCTASTRSCRRKSGGTRRPGCARSSRPAALRSSA
jgi:SAM-dependent methyltransferase